MPKAKQSEENRFWRATDIGHLELFRAQFISHRFSRHAHDTYVIGIIEKGAEGFHMAGTHHIAAEGSIVVINPGAVHTGHSVYGDGWKYRMMYPEKALLADVIKTSKNRFGIDAPYFPIPVIHDPLLSQRIYRLHCALEYDHTALHRQELFYKTMKTLILKHAQKGPMVSKDQGTSLHLKKVCNYIRTHLSEEISLKDLSSLARLSPFYFSRLFHSSMGISPHSYIIQLRVQCVKKAIGEGRSLSDAALKCGFYDQSHMNRHFKKHTGISPGQYADGDKQ